MGALAGFAGFLLQMVGPLVARAVIALGFTTLTFTGISIVVGQLLASAQASWAALPATTLQLASLFGAPEALGMIFGAYAAVWAMQQAAGFKRFVLKT